jgi:hypothetical protein
MLRLIFYIIVLIFAYGLPSSRTQRYYRYQYNNERELSDFIRQQSRRFFALRKCKNFITRGKNLYKLKNKYITLIYDTKNKIIKCYDNQNRKRTATIRWYSLTETVESDYYGNTFDANDYENIFEETFDTICNSFNENSSYDRVVAEFQNNFDVEQTNPEPEGTKIETPEVPYFCDKILDINKASEEELKNLPGISTILAKKIIQYRDIHCGFKSGEEFYSEMNIKPHFQAQLNNLICFEEYETHQNTEEKNDRIIDL